LPAFSASQGLRSLSNRSAQTYPYRAKDGL